MEKKHIAIVIICLGLTVCVGFGVWAINRWMEGGGGGLVMTKADEYDVANMSFFGTSGASTNYINMTIQNTGSSPWTLTSTAQVNSVTGLAVTPWWPNYNKATPAYNCTNGNTIKITIANVGWTSRQQYGVTFLLTDGDKITYSAIAP